MCLGLCWTLNLCMVLIVLEGKRDYPHVTDNKTTSDRFCD